MQVLAKVHKYLCFQIEGDVRYAIFQFYNHIGNSKLMHNCPTDRSIQPIIRWK